MRADELRVSRAHVRPPARAQESFFAYLFGVTEAGFYGALDLRSGEATLFAPRLPAEVRRAADATLSRAPLDVFRPAALPPRDPRAQYEIWMGHIPTPEELAAKCVRRSRSLSS